MEDYMSKQAKILLVISGLFTLAMGLSNVFVNIFLWKKSNSFILIASYQLMHHIFVPITFIIAGWLSKKKNGIWSLRIGIFSFIIFFSGILLLRESITDYIYIFGILFGISAGFYWLSFDVLTFDFTSTKNRDTFNGFYGTIASATASIAPISAAYIIESSQDLRGYYIVFFISLVLFIIQIIVSFFIKTETYSTELAFKKILKKNTNDWCNFRRLILTWGLRDVVIIFLITILIYKTTGSEIALGKLTFIGAIIACGANLLEQKIIKPKKRLVSMHVGAIFLFIAIIGLVFEINYTFLVIYTIISSIFSPFFLIPIYSATFNILDYCGEEEYRIEYIINKEIMLDFGRLISTTILILLLSFVQHDRTLNYFLLFIGSAQIICLYFIRKIKIWDK
jgi:YQGE family putative transporter